MSSSSYGDFYDLAEKEGNLNAGGSQSDTVPDGPYDGVVKFVNQKHPAEGKKFGLLVEISAGPYAGKNVWANIGMSKSNPRSASAFFITLEKFGLTSDFFKTGPSDSQVAAAMKDVPVTIDISHREWNSKVIQDGRISSVNKVSGLPTTAPLPPVVQQPVINPVAQPVQAAFNPLIGQPLPN